MGELLSLMRRRGNFSPLSVDGLVLWLDADDSATLTLSGSDVSQWADKSGGAHHASQGTAGQRPTRIISGQNGNNTVDYSTAAGDVLVASDTAALQNVFDGGGYVAMAFEPDAQNAADVAMILSKNAWMLWYTDTSANASDIALSYNFSGTNGKWSSTTRVLAHDTPFILEMSYNSSAASNDPTICSTASR